MKLSSKQARYLKGLAHHLKAVVMVGDKGVSEGVVEKVTVELENHELIKVKFTDSAPENGRDAGPKLAESAGASLVQVIGGVVILYRARSKKPTIKLPKASAPVDA